MRIYAVALTLDGKAKSDLAVLRLRYQHFTYYVIEPHITVQCVFAPETDMTYILPRIAAVAGRIKPFTLNLNGVKYWEGKNNVAYVAVENRQPVYEIHRSLALTLRGLATWDTTYDMERFIPHVTIAELIPPQNLNYVKNELASFNPAYRLRTDSLTVFSAEADRIREIWTPFRIFQFGKVLAGNPI